MSDPATWEEVAEWKAEGEAVLADDGEITWIERRYLALIALAEAERDEKNEALSREASVCDLLNTWARESNVEEAARQEELKPLADRLWAYWSRADTAERAWHSFDVQATYYHDQNESLRGTITQALNALKKAHEAIPEDDPARTYVLNAIEAIEATDE